MRVVWDHLRKTFLFAPEQSGEAAVNSLLDFLETTTALMLLP